MKAANSTSSPGPDGIPYNILQALGPIAQRILLRIYNDWFSTGRIPSSAFGRLITGIPKSDGGVRGITLSNSVLKIYERLLLPLVRNVLEPMIPSYQFGFTETLSSSHQLLNLLTTLQDSNQSHIALFYDISKAFDRLDRDILLHQLFKTNLDDRVKAAIRALLGTSQNRVVFGDDVSELFSVSNGVPQGGILSPILFNFYISDLATHCSAETIRIFAYADDIAIILSGTLISSLLEEALQVHRDVTSFFKALRLEINLSKSGSMLVTKTRPHQLNWPVEGLPPRVFEYKYLGAILDDKLSLKKWCYALKASVQSRTLLIRSLSSTKKLTRRQVELLYSAIVRGKLMYAASVWSRSKYAYIVYNADLSASRVHTTALVGTTHKEIEVESNLTPLKSLVTRADLRLCTAIRSRPKLVSLRDHLERIIHPLNEDEEHTTLYGIGMTPFSVGLLSDDYTSSDILRVLPSKPKRSSRMHWKNEALLARIRMGLCPTRMWAKFIGISDTAICRHCYSDAETEDHLFGRCKALDYNLLSAVVTPTFTEIKWELFQNSNRILENAVLQFIKLNDLFRLDGPPNKLLSEKRAPDLSLSPPPAKKRSSGSRKRKQTTSHSIPVKSAKLARTSIDQIKSYSGPAPFIRDLKRAQVQR